MLQQQSKVKPQPGTPRTLFTRTPLNGIIGQDADKSAKEGKKMTSRSQQLTERLSRLLTEDKEDVIYTHHQPHYIVDGERVPSVAYTNTQPHYIIGGVRYAPVPPGRTHHKGIMIKGKQYAPAARNEERVEDVAPPGWEGSLKRMKKHSEISNPYALSWWMKNRGDTPHYTKTGKKKRSG